MNFKNALSSLFKMMSVATLLMVVFLSGCDKDDEQGIAPTVLSSTPGDGSVDVAINSAISATFSQIMDEATVTNLHFLLKNGSANVAGAMAYDGTTATMTPLADLLPQTLYTATITGAKNAQGKSIARDFSWSFTTGSAPDNSAPIIASTIPAENATDVQVSQEVTVAFSEEMATSTINSTSMIMKKGDTPVAGTVSYSGMTAKFEPLTDLEYNTRYTVTIATVATDLAGNALASAHTFTFTTVPATDVTPPVVISTSPMNNATGVAITKIITVDFSELIDASTITASTFTLMEGSNLVNGSVTYAGTTATFTPDALLIAGTEYTATLTTGVKDLAEQALEADFAWTFSTTASGLAAVELRSAGNYVILAKTAINNIPTSAITGDMGLSPAATTFITGFALTDATGYATSPQVTGKVYAADMAGPTSTNLTTAVENMITAYNDAAGRPSPDFLELATGNIGGLTLASGLYKWTSTVTMPRDLVISGGPNDVWIFQISGDLSMSAGVNITLNGGAQAKNIFWQVAGEVTIGTTAHFEGIILSMTGITFQTGASMNGRALAQTAVILDANAVTETQ